MLRDYDHATHDYHDDPADLVYWCAALGNRGYDNPYIIVGTQCAQHGCGECECDTRAVQQLYI